MNKRISRKKFHQWMDRAFARRLRRNTQNHKWVVLALDRVYHIRHGRSFQSDTRNP